MSIKVKIVAISCLLCLFIIIVTVSIIITAIPKKENEYKSTTTPLTKTSVTTIGKSNLNLIYVILFKK